MHIMTHIIEKNFKSSLKLVYLRYPEHMITTPIPKLALFHLEMNIIPFILRC